VRPAVDGVVRAVHITNPIATITAVAVTTINTVNAFEDIA
jgi:hypothetical protein